MKKLVRPAILMFLACSGAVSLPACEDDSMEEVGEEIDEAADDIEDAAD